MSLVGEMDLSEEGSLTPAQEASVADELGPELEEDDLYKDFDGPREFHVLDEINAGGGDDDDDDEEDDREERESLSGGGEDEEDSDEDFDIREDEIEAMLDEGMFDN